MLASASSCDWSAAGRRSGPIAKNRGGHLTSIPPSRSSLCGQNEGVVVMPLPCPIASGNSGFSEGQPGKKAHRLSSSLSVDVRTRAGLIGRFFMFLGVRERVSGLWCQKVYHEPLDSTLEILLSPGRSQFDEESTNYPNLKKVLDAGQQPHN